MIIIFTQYTWTIIFHSCYVLTQLHLLHLRSGTVLHYNDLSFTLSKEIMFVDVLVFDHSCCSFLNLNHEVYALFVIYVGVVHDGVHVLGNEGSDRDVIPDEDALPRLLFSTASAEAENAWRRGKKKNIRDKSRSLPHHRDDRLSLRPKKWTGQSKQKTKKRGRQQHNTIVVCCGIQNLNTSNWTVL